MMRTSDEIDAYPGNYREWQQMPENEGIPASEEINALFGYRSEFDETHGFYIDGCDDRSARLPQDWQQRAVYKTISAYGANVTLIAPSIEDMTLSKLVRLAEKDRAWIASLHGARPLAKHLLLRRMEQGKIPVEVIANARNFLATLPNIAHYEPPQPARVPLHPEGTHCAFFVPSANLVTVRKWDQAAKVYHRIDNPLGPAVIEGGNDQYFLDGIRLSIDQWKSATCRQAETEDLTVSNKP